jgi:hypothetical protein
VAQALVGGIVEDLEGTLSLLARDQRTHAGLGVTPSERLSRRAAPIHDSTIVPPLSDQARQLRSRVAVILSAKARTRLLRVP